MTHILNILQNITNISTAFSLFQEGNSQTEDIFSIEYQPKVLDCFCSNTVRHFYPSTWDEILLNSQTMDLKMKEKFRTNPTGNNIVMPKPVYFTKRTKPTINQLSDEDIQNIAVFCFPGKVITFLQYFQID